MPLYYAACDAYVTDWLSDALVARPLLIFPGVAVSDVVTDTNGVVTTARQTYSSYRRSSTGAAVHVRVRWLGAVCVVYMEDTVRDGRMDRQRRGRTWPVNCLI